MATYEYSIQLLRANDTFDALEIQAYDKNNVSIDTYTGPIELGLDDWIKIIYRRTAVD